MKLKPFFFIPLISLFWGTVSFGQQLAFKASTQKSKPFLFIENKGQIADKDGNVIKDTKYYTKNLSVNVYCKGDRIAFVFSKFGEYHKNQKDSTKKFQNLIKDKLHNKADSINVDAARMEMQFIHPNPDVEIVGEEIQDYCENYYLASCPQGITVNGYKKLVYKNLWPQIDMILSAGNNKGMEYSFILHPGGNIKDIQIQWNGTETLNVLENSIEYANSLGNITETNLNAYLDN